MLETYLKPVLSKHRGVALGVWGEAGIGKSYTVAATLKNLPCQRLSLHATTSFASFVGQLTKPKKLALWADRTLDKVGQGEEVENSNLISALSSSLSGLAPFVLHLEDAHEANAERLEFLRELAQTVQKLRGVGLLVTSRQELTEPFRAVKVGPLSREASDKLLETELKATLPREGLEFIFSRAAGNPLFTLEYLRFIARQGHLWNDGKTWHWRKPEQERLPVVVEALLEGMILQAKTMPMHRYVLESKALLPLEASMELWEKVARVTSQELTATTRELSEQGIFKETNFAHPLFREVTLKTLSAERKRDLSRRATNALKDDPVQAAVFVEDAKLEGERTLELLTQAATHLENKKKKIEAARCLEKTLTYVTGEEKGQLALKAAQLASRAGDSRALNLAQLAATHLHDATEAQKIIALSHALRGEKEEMKRVLSQIEHQADSNYLIKCLFTASAYEEVIRLVGTGIDLEGLDENSLYFIAWAYIDKGNLDAALALAEERLNQKQLSVGAKANLLDIRASVLHYQGKYVEADPVFSEVIHFYKEDGESWDGAANALRNRALNRLQMDVYQGVVPDFLASLAIYAERGASLFYAETLVMLSEAYFELADYEKVEAILLEALGIFERTQSRHFHAYALSSLIHFYAQHQRNSLLATGYAKKALAVVPQLSSNFYEMMVDVAVSSADTLANHLPQALVRADKALSLARDAGLKELSLKAQLNKARVFLALHKEAEARELFQIAMQEATQAGTMLVAHKMGLELDRLNNDVESARTRMQWFEERGLMNGVNIAKRYFPELAVTDVSPNVLTIEEPPRLEVLGLMQVSHNIDTPLA